MFTIGEDKPTVISTLSSQRMRAAYVVANSAVAYCAKQLDLTSSTSTPLHPSQGKRC